MMTKDDYYSPEVTSHVKRMVAPLFKALEINYFTFVRVYENGGSICLTTHHEWAQRYEQMHLYRHGIGLRHPRLYRSCSQLGDHAILLHHYAAELIKVFNDLKIDHLFNITRSFGSYMDRFYLATQPNNYKINQVYLNNLELITAFTWHFLDIAHLHINHFERNRRVYPVYDQLFVTPDETWVYPTPNIIELTRTLENRKLIFTHQDKMITLTPCETTCLRLLVKNKNHKSVAKLLGRSPRTIETHVNNIKYKLSCRTMSEIIDKILANESARYFVYEFPLKNIC